MVGNDLTLPRPDMGGRHGAHDETARPNGAWLGLLPILLAMPCLYWPKLIESDTQPWISIAAALSFLFYWPRREGQQSLPLNLGVTAFSILIIALYWLRAPEIEFFIRYAAIILTFLMLWHVASRGQQPIVGDFVRATIVIWFAIGLAQTIIVRLGLPIEIFGRFTPGRSGVPSLTAEASFYGSLSVLQLMYLITDKRGRRDAIFVALAVTSVLLSGSLLSFLLLIVPAARLPGPLKVVGGILALLVVVVGVDIFSAGFFARVQDINILTLGPEYLLQDASTNYRAGHVWFTWFANLPRELFLTSSADFEFEYNGWVSQTPLFLMHDSDFILSSGGELLFRSGPLGAVIIWFILSGAFRKSGNFYEKMEKTIFVFLCLLNPISIANPFLIFYIHKAYRRS